MKLFVGWARQGSKLTDNWHDGGGFVVSGVNEDAAIERLLLDAPNLIRDELFKPLEEIGRTDKDVCHIFEDAGCC
jgi:hypothetical protein